MTDALIGNKLQCEQPYCTTISTMLGFGSVLFRRVERQEGYAIRCEWEYDHAGLRKSISGIGVNEREALFDAAEQKPTHEVVRDPVLSH